MTEKAISEAGEEHAVICTLAVFLSGVGQVSSCFTVISPSTEIRGSPGAKTAFIWDKF